MKFILLLAAALIASAAFSTPFDDAVEKAEAGDVESQLALWSAFVTKGRYDEAVYWSRMAAEQGDATSQSLLGTSYKLGLGVKANHAKAIMWWEKASEQGYGEAQYLLATLYGEDDKSIEKATGWMVKAAESGYATAQLKVALMYHSGKYLSQNHTEAFKWFGKAANQGNAAAQYSLGLMYANGEGVPENNIRAYVWWSMSKTQGIALAAKNIDILKPMLTPKQLAAGQVLAAKCYESNYKDCE